MEMVIKNIGYDNHTGWTFDVMVRKEVDINGKKIEMRLNELAVGPFLSDYKVFIDSSTEFTPEEYKQLKVEKEKFVEEIKQILNLK